ncbi:MAG TPA: hypothetical protein V6C72_00300 [Chroococcales cyanobacterium]
MHLKKMGYWLCAIACAIGPAAAPGFCDGEEQAIFQDEHEMMRDNQHQLQQYENQDQMMRQDIQQHDSQNQAYRLYAEQRVQQLEKLKAAGGSPSRALAKDSGQLYALESWLKRDSQDRAAEQSRLRALDQAIANLRDTTTATQQNLSADISAMREDENQKAADNAFDKMMRINQFNELQSEMGAASWGRPPTDGTFNSTGAYGMGGGYGYSFGGGRRW